MKDSLEESMNNQKRTPIISVSPDKTRKADGIRRRWCKPSRPTRAGAHG